MRRYLLSSVLSLPLFLHGQPDTLYVPELGTVSAYAVVYGPLQGELSYRRIGRYAMDTSRVAVELDYRQGRPCGIYRAYFPDGRPLIFAVYGFSGLHGDWAEYDELGRITVKGQYRNGLRDGTWAFRGEGVVGHYKEGRRHGRWKYYENGRLVRTAKYHDDKLVKGSEYLMGP